MKITIETIKGRKCTVIWHVPREPDGIDWPKKLRVGYVIRHNQTSEHVATVLPALPRHPKPEHAPLLYRYMAEGIEPMGESVEMQGNIVRFPAEHPIHCTVMIGLGCGKITHAIFNGERVEIAIED